MQKGLLDKVIIDNSDKELIIVLKNGVKACVYLEAVFYADETDSGVNEYVLRIRDILSKQRDEYRPCSSIEISEKNPPQEVRSAKGELLWTANET